MTEKTIYAKVDEKVFNDFQAMSKEVKKSQAQLLSDFINYFTRLYSSRGGGENGHRYLLQTIARDFYDTAESESGANTALTAALVAKNAWAEHSFSRGRGFESWTIEAYREVRQHSLAGGKALTDMRRLADYRLGFCWTRMAIRMRSEALDNYLGEAGASRNEEDRIIELLRDWKKAITAAGIAAAYFDSLNRDLAGGRDNPVGYYNRACALSMVCQYSVEARALSRDPEPRVLARKLAESLLHKGSRNLAIDKGENKEAYVAIPDWRAACGNEFAGHIDGWARTSLGLLEQLRSPAEPSEPTLGSDPAPRWFPSDTQWLVQLAREDSDLHFLRHEYASDFTQWLRNAGGVQLGQAYEHLERMGATDPMGSGAGGGDDLRRSVHAIVGKLI